MAGLISGGLFGRVNSDRFQQAVSRLRSSGRSEDEDPDQLERDLLTTLRSNPTTRRLDLGVRALGGGLVELTGNVPEEATRELAGRLARAVPGADVVVNRILVDGKDTADNGQGPVSQVT
jgi:osmotically-inducible protein OsmY